MTRAYGRGRGVRGMRAVASHCVLGIPPVLVGFLSRGGIPPVLVGFLSPSVIGADVALDDARRVGRTGRACAVPRSACGGSIWYEPLGCVVAGSPD